MLALLNEPLPPRPLARDATHELLKIINMRAINWRQNRIANPGFMLTARRYLVGAAWETGSELSVLASCTNFSKTAR